MTNRKRGLPRAGKLQILIVLAFWMFWAFGTSAAAYDFDDEEKRVLFISSYSFAWDTVRLQIEGIEDGLGDEVVLDCEFMDTKRVDDAEARELFRQGLAYRLSQVEAYDAVILGDDAALQFALEYREELFQGIPLVFEGINDEQLAEQAVKEPLVTGVIEKLSLETNIEFGLLVNPAATKVVAILDGSLTGEVERKRYYECAEKYPGLSFQEINVSHLSTASLRYAIQSVSQDSILIYIVMTEDANGKLYTSREAVRVIVENANVPALRMVEAGIGEGLLGGSMVSMYKSGEIAAQLALEMMADPDCPRAGTIVDSPNIYCVDGAVMEKFGIDYSVLPEGTDIINRRESLFERNREVIIPGVILILVLLLVILWVGISNYRRRKLLQELEEARRIMETASLHDFLTGLPNRRKFMNDLEELIQQHIPCTVMMLDIDDFKGINDSLGHLAGDEALKQVASRLKDMETQIMSAYRYAGDEFIVILRSSQQRIVEKTAFQCRQIFAKPFKLGADTHRICGSIGIAAYPKDTENLEQLIVCADAAMYQVKKNGKNDFAFYKAESVS